MTTRLRLLVYGGDQNDVNRNLRFIRSYYEEKKISIYCEIVDKIELSTKAEKFDIGLIVQKEKYIDTSVIDTIRAMENVGIKSIAVIVDFQIRSEIIKQMINGTSARILRLNPGVNSCVAVQEIGEMFYDFSKPQEPNNLTEVIMQQFTNNDLYKYLLKYDPSVLDSIRQTMTVNTSKLPDGIRHTYTELIKLNQTCLVVDSNGYLDKL